MLIMKADQAYPGKFDWTYNVRDVLDAPAPRAPAGRTSTRPRKPIEGGDQAIWRKGAFEVLRLDTNELLYSGTTPESTSSTARADLRASSDRSSTSSSDPSKHSQ